jgi:hypothetical protein
MIHYRDEGSFYKGVKEMVIKGLTFDAHHDTLVIILRGGY